MSKNGTVTIPIVEYDLLREYYKNHPKSAGICASYRYQEGSETITYFSDNKEVIDAIQRFNSMRENEYIAQRDHDKKELSKCFEKIEFLEATISKLKNRGFWARLFNK